MPQNITPTEEKLIARARETARNAYSPHSNFKVGAAVAAGGEIFSGCNVENASFGLTICAERSAVFAAIAGGHRRITAVAIHTETVAPTPPCGACRQVLAEFAAPDVRVIMSCANETPEVATIGDLLPLGFEFDAEN